MNNLPYGNTNINSSRIMSITPSMIFPSICEFLEEWEHTLDEVTLVGLTFY
jgi:hypothetical protein